MEPMAIVSLLLLGCLGGALLCILYLYRRLVIIGDVQLRALRDKRVHDIESYTQRSEQTKLASLLAEMTLQRDALLKENESYKQCLEELTTQKLDAETETQKLASTVRELQQSVAQLELRYSEQQQSNARLNTYAGELEDCLHEFRSSLSVVAGTLKDLYDSTRTGLPRPQELADNGN